MSGGASFICLTWPQLWRAPTVSLTVESVPDKDMRDTIAAEIVERKIGLLEIYNEELSLEDIFIRLVTKETT